MSMAREYAVPASSRDLMDAARSGGKPGTVWERTVIG